MEKLNNPQQNPLALRAKKLITEAFFDCLEENPYKKVKISEICRRAGVARSTFYNHYQTVEDVPYTHYLEDWFVDMKEIVAELFLTEVSFEDVSLATIEWVLRYWREHVEEYELLQTAEMESVLLKLFYQGTTIFTDKFQDQIGEFDNPAILECYLSQGAVSTLSLLKIWINTGLTLSAAEMAEILAIFIPVDMYELLYQRFEQK